VSRKEEIFCQGQERKANFRRIQIRNSLIGKTTTVYFYIKKICKIYTHCRKDYIKVEGNEKVTYNPYKDGSYPINLWLKKGLFDSKLM
jgi:hypothetical protein